VPGGWPRPNSEETYPLWVFTMTGVFEKASPCEGEQMREFYAGLPKPVPDKNEEVFRAGGLPFVTKGGAVVTPPLPQTIPQNSRGNGKTK